jgi:hypothetical protein
MLNKTASQKPLTSNPERNELVNSMMMALITRVKSPMEKTIRGIEIKIKAGLMKEFNKLIIIAAKSASLIEST